MYAVSANVERIVIEHTNLTSKLGNTDRQLESVCPVLDVGLEVREMYIVPVHGHLIDATVRAALLEEIDHPSHAIRSRSGAWSSKSVTLASERFEILVPSVDGSGDIHVSLRYFVDPEGVDSRDESSSNHVYVLIETICIASITGLGVLEEGVDMVIVSAPEHDADRKTRVLDCVWNDSIPKMEHTGTLGSDKEGDPRIITHSPSDSELSATGRSSRGIGWTGGGSGARRGQRGRIGRRRITLGRGVITALSRRVRWLGGGSACGRIAG